MMDECPVCGNDTFDEIDGYFFCGTCQSQNQNVRHEETGDNMVHTRGLALKARGTGQARSKISGEKGRPWEMVEALTLILKAQVTALVKMGVNPKLDDVVFKLWAIYLSKSGNAFNNNQEDKITLNMLADMTQCYRDLRPSTVEEPLVKVVRLKKPRKTISKAEMRKKQLEETLGDEEFYEEDNPLLDGQTGEDGVDDDIEEVRGETYGQSALTMQRSHTRPRLGNLLSILHLGLLFCHNTITTADLQRWVMKGMIPYRNCSALLPDNLKLNTFESCVFNYVNTPEPIVIQRTASLIAEFIGKTKFPLIDLRVFASKYILELGLPGELQALVISLIETFGPLLDVSRIDGKIAIASHAPEHIAMAFVVIILKMLFVLDDKHVRNISRYACAVNAACPPLQLFVWDDWLWSQRPLKKNLSVLPCNVRDALKVRDVSDCLAGHKDQFDKVRFSETKKNRDSFDKKATRELLGRPIKKLAKGLHPRTRLATPGNTTLPRESQPDAASSTKRITDIDDTFDLDIALGDGDLDLDGECCTQHGGDRHFWDSTVKYITEGHAFTDFLRKRMSVIPAEGAKDGVSASEAVSEEDDDMSPMQPRWHVSQSTFDELIIIPHAGCAPYILKKQKDTLSSSYETCLNICTELIGCARSKLLTWITRLEKKVFMDAIQEESDLPILPSMRHDRKFLNRLFKS